MEWEGELVIAIGGSQILFQELLFKKKKKTCCQRLCYMLTAEYIFTTHYALKYYSSFTAGIARKYLSKHILSNKWASCYLYINIQYLRTNLMAPVNSTHREKIIRRIFSTSKMHSAYFLILTRRFETNDAKQFPILWIVARRIIFVHYLQLCLFFMARIVGQIGYNKV